MQPGCALDAVAHQQEEMLAMRSRVAKLKDLCDMIGVMSKLQTLFDEFDRDMDEALIKSAAAQLAPMDSLVQQLAKEPHVGKPARALMLRRRAQLEARLDELVSSAISFDAQGIRVGFEGHCPSLKRGVRLEDIVAACASSSAKGRLDQIVGQGLSKFVVGMLLVAVFQSSRQTNQGAAHTINKNCIEKTRTPFGEGRFGD